MVWIPYFLGNCCGNILDYNEVDIIMKKEIKDKVTLSRIVRNISNYLFVSLSFLVVQLFLLVGSKDFDNFQSLVFIFMIVILIFIMMKSVMNMDLWYVNMGSVLLIGLNLFPTLDYRVPLGVSLVFVSLGVSKDIVGLIIRKFPKIFNKKLP